MLTVHGLALCQARTLQLTQAVYFLKRRPSTPSQLMGCRTGSAHSCIYFHWVPSQGGNYNPALNLDQSSLLCHKIFYLAFSDHSVTKTLSCGHVQASNDFYCFKALLSSDDGPLVYFCLLKQSWAAELRVESWRGWVSLCKLHKD